MTTPRSTSRRTFFGLVAALATAPLAALRTRRPPVQLDGHVYTKDGRRVVWLEPDPLSTGSKAYDDAFLYHGWKRTPAGNLVKEYEWPVDREIWWSQIPGPDD